MRQGDATSSAVQKREKGKCSLNSSIGKLDVSSGVDTDGDVDDKCDPADDNDDEKSNEDENNDDELDNIKFNDDTSEDGNNG